MRNPWGQERYTGAWSDGDSRWTEATKQIVGHREADDGIFFLPVDIFRQAFSYYYEGMYQNW